MGSRRILNAPVVKKKKIHDGIQREQGKPSSEGSIKRETKTAVTPKIVQGKKQKGGKKAFRDTGH